LLAEAGRQARGSNPLPSAGLHDAVFDGPRRESGPELFPVDNMSSW